MQSRYSFTLMSIVAAAAIAAPGVAQARHGSDDPVAHVRHEHHRFDHHARRDGDDVAGDAGRGADDGPNHR
jgi:hypothetical protein